MNKPSEKVILAASLIEAFKPILPMLDRMSKLHPMDRMPDCYKHAVRTVGKLADILNVEGSTFMLDSIKAVQQQQQK